MNEIDAAVAKVQGATRGGCVLYSDEAKGIVAALAARDRRIKELEDKVASCELANKGLGEVNLVHTGRIREVEQLLSTSRRDAMEDLRRALRGELPAPSDSAISPDVIIREKIEELTRWIRTRPSRRNDQRPDQRCGTRSAD